MPVEIVKGRQSSPRYPFIGLRKAIERIEALRKAAGTNPVLVGDARHIWGYGLKSSGGDQTIAALRSYGLIEDVNDSGNRKLKLTDDAQRYLRDERPEARGELLKRFVLKPKAMQQLWEMWKFEPPLEPYGSSTLKVDLGFSDTAATELMAVYKENLQFIKGQTSATLVASDESSSEAQNASVQDDSSPVNVGDFVQWESGGQEQFKAPKRVEWVSEDRKFARVFGSLTGIPMNELIPSQPPPHSLGGKSPATSSAYAGLDGDLNVLLSNGRLQITADLDLEGVGRLKEILSKYQEILSLLGNGKPLS